VINSGMVGRSAIFFINTFISNQNITL
jgi:hypothetical protein